MTSTIVQENSKIHECELCDYSTSYKYDLQKHFLTNKHKNNENTSDKVQKGSKLLVCDLCDYKTIRESQYTRHLLTDKHKKKQNTSSDFSEGSKNIKSNICKCGKEYKHYQSLNNHKKKCNFDNKNNNVVNEIIESQKSNGNDNNDFKEIIFKMFDTMQEQNKLLLEMIPKIGSNNNNTNNIKNKVNIQIFLNENYKDALSISEFVNNISVTVDDLLLTKDKGNIEGLSNLLVCHLQKLPLCQRPLWCSDKKRKKLYIKEETWKEDKDNTKTKEAINNVSKLQTKNINNYLIKHPNWMSDDNKKDEYVQIVKTVTESIEDKTDKIIDKIIDKIHFNEAVVIK